VCLTCSYGTGAYMAIKPSNFFSCCLIN
jgi:hypothetical protein